jgi:hypothetical protein
MTTTSTTVQEGFLRGGECQIWYRTVSPIGEVPSSSIPLLLLLHGGPRLSSEYLSGLESLAAKGRVDHSL